MKQLFAPTVEQVISSPHTSGVRSGGSNRPACLASVWRDCAAGIAYYVFHDGTIYSYPSPSIQDAVAVLTSPIHGIRFNRGIRRFVAPGTNYSRIGSIPGSAVQIYSNPPYPGTDPGLCPTGQYWTWGPLGSFPAGSGGFFTPSPAPQFENISWAWNPNGVSTYGSLHLYGSTAYVGPAATMQMAITLGGTHSSATMTTFWVFFQISGVPMGFQHIADFPNGSYVFQQPFAGFSGSPGSVSGVIYAVASSALAQPTLTGTWSIV